MRQGLGFHLQVNLGIDMRGLQRHVSQPRADRIDIHPGSQEMHGRRMSVMPRTALAPHQCHVGAASYGGYPKGCVVVGS